MYASSFMEAIGTFFLVLSIGLTGDPFTIGLTLMVMIYMGASVSGAHFNPAASLSIWLRRACPQGQMIRFIVFQVLGATLAGITVRYLTGATFAPQMAYTASIPQAFLAEFLFTYALCSVILTMTTSPDTKGNDIYGFAIGMTVAAGAFAVGPISGGVFNPAVALGPMLANLVFGEAPVPEVWIHVAAPLLGGVVASFTYLKFHEEY